MVRAGGGGGGSIGRVFLIITFTATTSYMSCSFRFAEKYHEQKATANHEQKTVEKEVGKGSRRS